MKIPEFLQNPNFWSSLITLIFALWAIARPDLKDTFQTLTPLIITLILAILGKSAAIQIAAFGNGYELIGEKWTKTKTQDASSIASEK